jgi:hypothetical protein
MEKEPLQEFRFLSREDNDLYSNTLYESLIFNSGIFLWKTKRSYRKYCTGRSKINVTLSHEIMDFVLVRQKKRSENIV